ncbi:MAG TPA: serine/threonine-protein kinase [Solirubrobacteraceae bacterium]|nr:serine/threonine-protein kinase [Solirubrobacteraceae bacterium]
MAELTAGDMLGGCRVEGVIARGGMGVVYRAVQLDLQRPVALKVIAGHHAEDPEFRERFGRESRMAAAIDHPNVVPVYGAGEDGGALYIVMRFVPGSDLHALIKSAGRVHAQRAAAIVAQVASALDAAHAAGLVHRDIKPANVLLSSDGDHAYLSDFGLMRAVDPDAPLTDSGSWIGTVDFAAPEQLSGARIDARSDVYSLGCVLFAALTGAPPFQRGTVPATLLAHLHDPPPRASAAGAPAHFDRVVARALAKDPDARYPSAGDLGRAALAAGRGETVTESERTVAIGPAAPRVGPEPTAATAVVARRRRRRLGRRGLAATLVLPLAGIATVAALMLGADDSNDIAAVQSQPLTETEVRAAADAFAQAYETEDGAALRRILSGGVQRVLPSGTVRGRNRVATEYDTQFRTNDTQSYELEDLDVRGGLAGRAGGRYRVRRSGAASITGLIAFGVVRDRGRTQIALITVTPDA